MSLQAENITIDVSRKLLNGLIVLFNELLLKESDHAINADIKMAVDLALEPMFPERKTRQRQHIYSHESD